MPGADRPGDDIADSLVQLKGLPAARRALRSYDKALDGRVKTELKAGGELVRSTAQSMFSKYDSRSAAGYRVVVRARGVAVEQRYGRTTGLHADYGRLQLATALFPARDAREPEVAALVDAMLSRLAAENGF